MKSFYKKWLEKNKKENEEVSTATSKTSGTKTSSKENLDVNIVLPSTSVQEIPASQTDIIFENKDLKMVVEKGAFQRQKRFRFQDHLFFVKIILKDNNETVPFLRDILEFIHFGLLHLMKTIKQFYKEEDENICRILSFKVNNLEAFKKLNLFC